MIKSFSVSDTQNTSPFSGQVQPYLKPAQHFDDDLILENIKHASYFLTSESHNNLSPTPGDRSKKRIKLLVNQKFPTDFFDQPPDEGQENNRTYYLKNIPVKVVRTPEVLQSKNSAIGEQRHANNTPSFGSQLMTSMDPSHNEDRTVTSRNKLLEGPPSREMITDIKHNTQARSRSHERGSFTGAGLYSLRMRPQPLNSKLRLEEINPNFSSVAHTPLQPIENDQRSTSRLKRGGLQTPRKDTLSSFRKPRQVTFNLNSEEKLYNEGVVVTPNTDTNHVIITNSYYYSSRGLTYQPDQAVAKPAEEDFQSLQAYRKEPLKLAKSASRDSFHRENEFLRISRTNRLYLKSINKEQASLPLTSSRKTLRVFKADELENSRMTSEREIEHHFTTESAHEKTARQKIVPQKSFANFHKTLIKSIGLSPQEPLTTKHATSVTKTISMLDYEPRKENSIDLITKIGRKVAEQRNHRDITESYMMREGHDFSFSKEYSKDESSIPTLKAQVKDIREKSPSPEKIEKMEFEQRNIVSRSQTRIRKKFVLVKREESIEKGK